MPLNSNGTIKRGILSAFIYAATTVALAGYLDGYYARDLGTATTGYLLLLHVSTAGACLFAISFVLSFFNLRFSIITALAASILAWPYFGMLLPWIPWGHLIESLALSDWLDQYISILMLIVSTVYSVVQLRMSFRASVAD
jgi:hypothetical protein